MSYIFKGNLRGLLCAECAEPLAGVTIRLYRPIDRPEVITHAVASPKDTFSPVSPQEVLAKADRLLAELVIGESGDFEVALDKGYQGGAFEIDIYCGTVPKGPPRPKATPQFSITTLQPQWRQRERAYVAAWEYQIPQRFWCAVRGQLGAWVICGRVLHCETRRPLGGLRVRAFDCDWLQHDALGEATTDASGHFRIDYAADAFKKTIFPGLALEWTGGPDVYFHVDAGASPILREPPARGRQSDRDNVGPCFCVELCVSQEVPVPRDPEPLAVFDSLGHYHFPSEVAHAVGGSGLTSDDRAFYSTVRLNGVLPRKLDGVALEYRFEVRATDAAGNSAEAWTPIDPTDPARCAQLLIGRIERYAPTFPLDPNPVKSQLVYATPGAPPAGAVRADVVGGWVRVPQRFDVLGAEGNFVPNGNMLAVATERLVASPVISVAGVKAGQSTTALGAPLSQIRYLAVRMRVRQVGAPSSEINAGECTHFAVDNTRYDGVAKGGSWMPHVLSGQLAAVSVDALQLRSNGCAGVHDDLDVVFTCAHPRLGAVQLSMSGPGGPYAFTLPPRSAGEHFGAATNSFTFSALADCAYIIDLSAQLLLTTGDSVPDLVRDRIGFCKRSS